MAGLFEIKRTSTDPALISFSENGVERLHHTDTEIARWNHKEYAVLEALDVVIRTSELFQQQGSVWQVSSDGLKVWSKLDKCLLFFEDGDWKTHVDDAWTSSEYLKDVVADAAEDLFDHLLLISDQIHIAAHQSSWFRSLPFLKHKILFNQLFL